jgi:hypothetical protein
MTKKNINPNVAARYPFRENMETDNQRHRDCTQPVNVGTVTQTLTAM